MKYYTSDELLKLKEYGRNIQNMVTYAKTLKDAKERNALVQDIIRIMTLLHPALKENPDYKQKLWDNLCYLADFDLDVDSEFPIPAPDVVLSRPKKRMPYYNMNSRFRQYGHNIELMIERAIAIEDLSERKALVTIICNMMKICIKGNDRDSSVEETVMEHLQVLSQGKLRYRLEDINFSKIIPTILAGAVNTAKPTNQRFQNKYSNQKNSNNKFNTYKKKFKK